MGGQIAIGYFVLLAVAALVRPLPAARRALIVSAAAAMSAAISFVSGATGALRDWFPIVIVLVAYYLSGLLFVRPSNTAEEWLMSWDRRLLGEPARAFAAWPAWLLNALDVLYLFTFLTVPAGLAALFLAGEMRLADRYWAIVMTSLLICYAGAAFIQTRPPRTLERLHERSTRRMQRAAFHAVEKVSIGVNTIPSGHVAAPLAIALALMEPLPVVAGAFFAFAIIITAACITGRYHFVVDCVLGAIVAVVVSMIAY